MALSYVDFFNCLNSITSSENFKIHYFFGCIFTSRRTDPSKYKACSAPEALETKLDKQWLDVYPQLNLTDASYDNALSALYSVWGYRVDANNVNCERGKSVLLSCYIEKIPLSKLKQLNYPSVVRLEKDNQTEIYAVIYKIAETYQLLINGYLINVSEQWFKDYWTGDITLLWKSPFPLKGTIKYGQDNEQVAWLVNQLNKKQGWPSEHKTHFDLRLLEQVSSFQREAGLIDDGIVGPHTLMQLAVLIHRDYYRKKSNVDYFKSVIKK
ncbi:peptidoglycan-binding protein [Psychromonas sp. KJ10-10]|uniref:peptidoglycan-binding protein n=1 Tax=Psychromonas sp. KJ10-10 TaxID=3391823 RepID=UPI0039B43C2E